MYRRYTNKFIYLSIGKPFGESVESVLKKKKKAAVGRIAEKEGLKPGMKE